MSFASFISQSKLPSAVRVRLASTNDPAILDEAYKATAAISNEGPEPPSNQDGWTSIPPPPVLSDDELSPYDLVQSFSGTKSFLKSYERCQDGGKLVERLFIDKQTSLTGLLLFVYLCDTREMCNISSMTVL